MMQRLLWAPMLGQRRFRKLPLHVPVLDGHGWHVLLDVDGDGWTESSNDARWSSTVVVHCWDGLSEPDGQENIVMLCYDFWYALRAGYETSEKWLFIVYGRDRCLDAVSCLIKIGGVAGICTPLLVAVERKRKAGCSFYPGLGVWTKPAKKLKFELSLGQ